MQVLHERCCGLDVHKRTVVACVLSSSRGEGQVERLRTIPGVGPRTAEVILAEVGVDMERFPSASHLAAWAGMSPGNNQALDPSPAARAQADRLPTERSLS